MGCEFRHLWGAAGTFPLLQSPSRAPKRGAVLRTAQGLLPHAPSSSRGFQVPQLQCHAMRNNAPAAALSKSNQRLWGCHLAFGVHIDLITSMANLEHNAANEYLGLIERAENGAPRSCANWTAPSSGQ
jgi:hypothetical protein